MGATFYSCLQAEMQEEGAMACCWRSRFSSGATFIGHERAESGLFWRKIIIICKARFVVVVALNSVFSTIS